MREDIPHDTWHAEKGGPVAVESWMCFCHQSGMLHHGVGGHQVLWKKKSRSLHHLPSRVMNNSNVQIVNHRKEIATVHDRKMYLNLAEPWKEKLSVKKEKIRQVVWWKEESPWLQLPFCCCHLTASIFYLANSIRHVVPMKFDYPSIFYATYLQLSIESGDFFFF